MENTETGRPRFPKQSPFQTRLQLSEAYLKLGRGLYDGALESRKQLSDAATSFITAKHRLEQETAKRAMEAYSAYAKAVQEARTKENSQELLAEAYQNYASTLSGLQQDSYRRLQELYGTLWTTSTETSENASKQAQQHYVDYLKLVQEVLSTSIK